MNCCSRLSGKIVKTEDEVKECLSYKKSDRYAHNKTRTNKHQKRNADTKRLTATGRETDPESTYSTEVSNMKKYCPLVATQVYFV